MNSKFAPIYFLFLIFSSCQNIIPDQKSNNPKEDRSKWTQTAPTKTENNDSKAIQYVNTFRDTSIYDNYHGKTVNDPYRWLEDDNSKDTKEWVKKQNATTNHYLNQIPFRKNIKKRLGKLWDYVSFANPTKVNRTLYYFKNSGLQDQPILYGLDSTNKKETAILDPNQLSDDGNISLGYTSFSKNGKYLAYQISEGGSDWRKIKVMDLESSKVLEDEVNWIKFSGISWFNNGFFYSRYPKPKEEEKLSAKNKFHQVYYHQLGQNELTDELIFMDRSNPNANFYSNVTEDGEILAIQSSVSTSGNALYVKDLTKADRPFLTLVKNYDHDYNVIGHDDGKLLVLTNHKAANWRLISINLTYPEEEYWEEIIPERKDVLKNVHLIGGNLVSNYIHNASSFIKIYNAKGLLVANVELPDIGKVGNISGNPQNPEAYFTFNTFTQPSTIYKLDVNLGEISISKKPDFDFDHTQYVTKQIWYESADKTKIPMFITHKKGLKRDGDRPVLLYGYGGFNIPILPGFNTTRLNMCIPFIEQDGIFAVANIRGGGEFGKNWHLAGTKSNKQNVFNDFISAAEWLMEQQYTNNEKIAIYGRSNGGLLVGACMTQRPELFQVALPAVGVLDMLRYQNFTIGRAWKTDYGLSEVEDEFDHLISYSPLHNVANKKYPATLVTTSDHDDRVVPAHSFKFASELQYRQKGHDPVLIRVDRSAGHGSGKSTSKKIEEGTDLLSFIYYNFKMDFTFE